ncbi:MAG: RimK-like ATPgrasp N-terminal domain-containing protein [Methanotrichaceae archaeon]|nr:RimK-like ATPgrasp N-terminal domain-containing protein [Methanotrichaceae archaeon]
MNKRKRDHIPKKDIMYTLNNHDSVYIINESYFYKTEPYYTIVRNEHEGIATVPSSSDVLDAYIVPICMEKARMNEIPACDWNISYSHVDLPAVIYGLNYFSTPSDHFVVRDPGGAKKVIKHVTNHGKYPFCYQRMGEEASVACCTSIFGKTIDCCQEAASLAERVYEVFRIPLVEMVLLREEGYRLSALAPVKYSQLTEEEMAMLQSLLEMGVGQ